MSPRLLWLAAVAAMVLGTALVFGAVGVAGLFVPGAVLIDVALLLAVAAGVLQLRATHLNASATPADMSPMPAPRT